MTITLTAQSAQEADHKAREALHDSRTQSVTVEKVIEKVVSWIIFIVRND